MALVQVEVVVAVCPCRQIGLEDAMHANADAAWTFLAGHVALNPQLCRPSMHRDVVPAALAPRVAA